ncbi:hypothetical protein BO82DRAFT_345929 [Aspergillus uvarum CBS 121591]|uniref:Jacalin-type lectin domain-containing protein n=1 Tax=Aspergillus uvarum CBS 121591 TaxID=1448315 RepID=A0A319BWD3_9EURO|nr:hypothetical protein BO82DRAFT_345929 [Aspergillus uvarum CBS 121591]PYH77004.1 hypothetical protein BO82DRAFT_345929 [Aspergillus uvarum CBS 121591]
MSGIEDLVQDGPYGGLGGSAYNATHEEQKIRRLDAWSADYSGYNVLGAIQFTFQDGSSSGRVGGRDPNIGYNPKSFVFDDEETIDKFTVYAGDNEGFVNGFNFHTTQGNEFEIGSTDGLESDVPSLGSNGEWAGAAGRDSSHGADAVIDSMILYFK